MNNIISLQQTRLSQLRKTMTEKELDGVLVMNPVNMRYYSGFGGSAGWLLITALSDSKQDCHGNYIITDGRYYHQATLEAPLFHLVKAEHNKTCPITDAFLELINRLSSTENPIKKIGIEYSFITLSLYNTLKKELQGIDMISCEEIIENPRRYKDREEMKKIKKVIWIAEKAFEEIQDKIKPGVTERELSALLQYRMKLLGADKESFDIIVASGENSSKPHAEISDRPLGEGEPITFDWGAKKDGYNSDMTRTLWIGEMNGKMKEIYQIVKTAQQLALDGIKPGMTCGEADALARNYIREKGYDQYFSHGLGHGVGLNIHEAPRLKRESWDLLEPGMVVTVEPGIYIPAVGGVRIEDMVLITQEGREILTSLPKM